jgi:uncharacterized protein YukE
MLLFLAYAIMAEALAQLAQQIQAMQQVSDEANQTAQGLKDKWTGDDSDKFQEVVQQDIIPGLGNMIGIATGFSNGLQQAQEIITQADNTANQAIGELQSVFSSI